MRVIEGSTAHEVDCWACYARMHMLRSPNSTNGIGLGIPSRHSGHRFEANYGKKAWDATDPVTREDRNEYLTRYRDVTGDGTAEPLFP